MFLLLLCLILEGSRALPALLDFKGEVKVSNTGRDFNRGNIISGEWINGNKFTRKGVFRQGTVQIGHCMSLTCPVPTDLAAVLVAMTLYWVKPQWGSPSDIVNNHVAEILQG